jgi:lipopolysaccharide transport system permease protein
MIQSLWKNHELVIASVQREVIGRYRGSTIGVLWSFLNPLIMLTVYTFVFSIVFKSRWVEAGESTLDFSLLLFSNLIIYNFFSECINKAPSLILANPNYVKKVVFPLEILPWISLFSSLFHAFVSFCVWLIAYVYMYGFPKITILYMPAIILELSLLIMGISWALACLGVYLRDISQLIGPMTTVMMYLSPIFYPPTALPEKYRLFLYFNPITPIIEQTRAALFGNVNVDYISIVITFLFSMMISWIGFIMFQKTRRGFADVI